MAEGPKDTPTTQSSKYRGLKGGTMKIEVKQPAKEELEGQGVMDWPIWEKEVSRFDWHYDSEETCYLLEGQVEVTTPDGQAKEHPEDFPKCKDCHDNPLFFK